MEHFGGAVEKTVEGAANALDKSMNRAWSFGPVRLIGKALSFCAGAGLMASYFPLKEKGCHKAAKFCLISGGISAGQFRLDSRIPVTCPEEHGVTALGPSSGEAIGATPSHF